MNPSIPRLILILCAVGSFILPARMAAGDTNALPPCCRKALDTKPPTDRSLYLLDSAWASDARRRIPLKTFRGRPQVVALFFTRCEYACPITVAELKRLESTLSPMTRDAVDFLLISMDPERDSPEALAGFRRTHALAAAHWSLLTGEADDVRELAALLGINFKQDGRGQFAHSNLITVLNAEGEIAHQYAGLKLPVEEAAALLDRLVAAGAIPAADR